MHIKKFEGSDLKEALSRVRAELGPDAVILETGRDAARGVSVLAAMPRTDAWETRRAEAASALAASAEGPRPVASRPGSTVSAAPSAPAVVPPAPAQAVTTPELELLHERVRLLNHLVRSDHFSAVPLPLRQLYFDLTDAEVDADLAFRILQRMGSSPMRGQFTPAPPGELLRFLQAMITVGGEVAPGQGRRVLALVGPTGVGKTTTAAKIAGHAAFRLGLEVALLSTDSYRVFGAQHLSSYAALMGIPFEVVSTAAEMRWYLQGRLSRTDLVLVDTSGRSPRDPRGIEEIHQLLAACPELDVHLVLAASTRARDLALALRSFGALPVRHLLFTKMDEATSTGGAFTTALKARRPVSYLGTGQEVPDDLAPATPELLTRDLIGGDDV